jgi:hypothetical protein
LFPLLLLEGLNLHVKSITSLSARTPVNGRKIELNMLAGRFMIYFGLLFWLLPFGMAWAFIRGAPCCPLSRHGRDLCAKSQGHACPLASRLRSS